VVGTVDNTAVRNTVVDVAGDKVVAVAPQVFGSLSLPLNILLIVSRYLTVIDSGEDRSVNPSSRR
jgi:hypothetical protein